MYFGDTSLSSDEGTIHGMEFIIGDNHVHHAVWQRLADQQYHLEHRQSKDGGRTWEDTEYLNDLSSILSTLKVKPGANGELHLVGWAGAQGLFYKHWSPLDGWGAAEQINGDSPGGSVGDLAVDPDGLARIVWVDGNGAAYLVQGSSDQRWDNPKTLNIDQVEAIRIAIDHGGASHFVWIAKDGGIYYGAAP